MCEAGIKTRKTIIIFFPFEIQKLQKCYLHGDLETVGDAKIFFITKVFDTSQSKTCLSLFVSSKWNENETNIKLAKNWIYFEVKDNVLTLKKLKIQGDITQDLKPYHIIWINYDFKVLSQCEILSSDPYERNASYFNFLKEKIKTNINNEKKKKTGKPYKILYLILSFFSMIILKLSDYSKKQLLLSKYLNIALHIDSYLDGCVWAVKTIKEKKKMDIKVMNFLLSIFLDMLLGVLLLQWLNSKVSLDSSPAFFLLTAESIVHSIKNLINWLRGDPAGLKLNWAFNRVLATFFSFHIDIWWTFIGYLEFIVKIIFEIFLKLGLFGITFQASITADLLALVSFHVYCIYAYAAKLYSIQVSCLISLWRLFLGRKKNPLRGKVDSCVYSPEQLFVGTLGFTILLFLLPTTLLYYVVFTCIRLSILMMVALLMGIRYLNQTLPVYSSLLWLMRSPKISTGVEIMPHDSIKSDIILLTVKPVTYSWWETVSYFMPDCVAKPSGFNISDLLSSLISGKLIYPI